MKVVFFSPGFFNVVVFTALPGSPGDVPVIEILLMAPICLFVVIRNINPDI